jgi:nucleoside-diphosphate-sugar epimerase
MKQERFTVLGAGGFIGSRLLSHLRAQGHECAAVVRGEPLPPRRPLGHAAFCIGVTADFRGRPYETVRAHVCALADVLEKGDFESLLYLSSTRVYAGASGTTEDSAVVSNPTRPDDFYNLTKLAGEALCRASGRHGVRVVRLSNVYGDDFHSDNFLPSVIRDAVTSRLVELHSAPDSEKDYVGISDVVAVLPQVAVRGRQFLYNVASGRNTTNREILDALSKATGCTCVARPEAPTTRFPAIDISRLRQEFDFEPTPLTGQIPTLVEQFKQALHDPNRS